MLFRALIDRLFGTNDPLNGDQSHDDSTPSKLSYDRYPGLPQLLIRQLGGNVMGEKSNHNNNGNTASSMSPELVFPALDILHRAGPPVIERENICHLVKQQMGSKIWNIREMAARTMCSFVSKKEYLSLCAELLDSESIRTNNMWHGILMCVKLLIERHFKFDIGDWQGQNPRHNRLYLANPSQRI